MSFLIGLFSVSIVCALELKGVATHIDNNSVLYTEMHTITKNEKGLNQLIETRYIDKSGNVFATMKTDFSKSPFLPQIQFEDKRLQIKEELIWENDNKTIKLRRAADGKTEQKIFPLKEGMVAGQGFDNFIMANYEDLQKKPLPLKFGVLTSVDFFSFKGHRKEKNPNGYDKFGIQLSNALLRLFADELLVEYDPKTKQIMSYKGLSNIMTPEKKSQNVFIKYEVVQQ